MFQPAPFYYEPGWPISRRLTRALADRGAVGELRALADRGDLYAAEHLADVFARQGNAEALRARAEAESSVVVPTRGDGYSSFIAERGQTAARERLANYLARRNEMAELASRPDNAAASRLFTVLRHRGDTAGLRRPWHDTDSTPTAPLPRPRI